MKKPLLITGVALAISLVPNRSVAASFSGLYVFGDSLSDTGNVFAATDGAIPDAEVYYEGRFSNGPIWIDYLADSLGVTPKPVTQLPLGSALPENGVNFAYGGATTGFLDVLDPLGTPMLLGLQEQVNLFDALIPDGEVADGDALYVVWAGTNDYLFTSGWDPNSMPTTMPDVPVANLSNAIQTIFNQGGRNFLIANLIDLGHSPLILQNSILVGSSGILSQQVEDFNGGLNIELDRLKRELPGIKMQLLDINALFEQAFAGKFEFQNLTMSCLNQVSATPCSHPDDYLFWDFIHPSARAHRLLGEAAISTVHPPTPTSVPEPATLLGLSLLGILGLATRCQPAKK